MPRATEYMESCLRVQSLHGFSYRFGCPGVIVRHDEQDGARPLLEILWREGEVHVKFNDAAKGVDNALFGQVIADNLPQLRFDQFKSAPPRSSGTNPANRFLNNGCSIPIGRRVNHRNAPALLFPRRGSGGEVWDKTSLSVLSG